MRLLLPYPDPIDVHGNVGRANAGQITVRPIRAFLAAYDEVVVLHIEYRVSAGREKRLIVQIPDDPSWGPKQPVNVVLREIYSVG